MHEQLVGTVTHYWNGIEVAGVHIQDGTLNVGDRVHILGSTTDFEQSVSSLQVEHHEVQSVAAGRDVGLRVKDRVREHDMVYKVVGDAPPHD